MSEENRRAVVNLMNSNLVDLIDLSNAVRVAHWNVHGPQFAALHTLFGDFYNQLGLMIDEIAERIVQLKGTPMGNTQSVGNLTRLPEYSLEIRDGVQHVEELTLRYSIVAKNTRLLISQISALDDATSADIMTDASKMLDKALWMLEAHFL